jgi:tetratricopeptide (TPR) repeat protein
MHQTGQSARPIGHCDFPEPNPFNPDMKRNKRNPNACLLVYALAAGMLCAAETYQESLQAGDENRKNHNSDAALTEYEAAIGQAANATESSLAFGKKGYVLAFDKKDYPAAREQAGKALALESAGPIAQVTALLVQAECLMKADKDFKEAAVVLEKAAALEGVDWAQPNVALTLGDCFRFSGQFDKALASYQKVVDLSAADSGVKAVAHLNMGLTWQYDKPDYDKAKAAYATAVIIRPDLQSEVDAHLAEIPAGEAAAEPNP